MRETPRTRLPIAALCAALLSSPAGGASPGPVESFLELPRLTSPGAGASSPAALAQDRLDAIAEGLGSRADAAEREASLRRELPSAATLLLDPGMEEVPAGLLNRHRESVAAILDALAEGAADEDERGRLRAAALSLREGPSESILAGAGPAQARDSPAAAAPSAAALRLALARGARSLALRAAGAVLRRASPETPELGTVRTEQELQALAIVLLGALLILYGARNSLDWTAVLLSSRAPAERAGPCLESGYEVLRGLGAGGMGVVLEARDRALGRKVAIKRLREEIRADPRARDRFLEEARIVAALHHPNIVGIHAIYEDAGELSLVFEFVDGRTLAQQLARKGRLSLAEARYVIHRVCDALDFAHKRGVIHRDLTPNNVMLARDGSVKVMDFGIARRAKDILERGGRPLTVVGTPQYMAPEQELGQARPESDVFALGAMLYEMLTGRRPFPDTGARPLKQSRGYLPASWAAPGLPPEIEDLIDRALEPDPERRIRTPAEFLARLTASED